MCGAKAAKTQFITSTAAMVFRLCLLHALILKAACSSTVPGSIMQTLVCSLAVPIFLIDLMQPWFSYLHGSVDADVSASYEKCICQSFHTGVNFFVLLV